MAGSVDSKWFEIQNGKIQNTDCAFFVSIAPINVVRLVPAYLSNSAIRRQYEASTNTELTALAAVGTKYKETGREGGGGIKISPHFLTDFCSVLDAIAWIALSLMSSSSWKRSKAIDLWSWLFPALQSNACMRTIGGRRPRSVELL